MLLRPLLAACFSLLLATPASAAITDQDKLNLIADAFYQKTVLDESKSYAVKDLEYVKDIGKFVFKSGAFYPAAANEGIVTAAVFIGEGSVSITPIRPMDKKCLDLAAMEHLKKKPGGKVETTFTEMLLVNIDGTLVKMFEGLSVGGGDVRRATEVFKDRIHVIKSQEAAFDLGFVQRVAGLEDGPLYLDFKTPDYDWLTFVYSPREAYEVTLASREKVGSFYENRLLIVTHKSSDLDVQGNYTADALKDQKPYIDVKKYRMEIEIPDTRHFLVEADVTFTPLVEDLPVVYFDLVNTITGRRSTDKGKPIHLTKVTADGKPLPFIHRKNAALVIPPEPLKLGQDYTFHFSLDEETIIQLSSVHFWVLNTYPWYPQHGYLGGQAAMDWTIKAKKPLVATGSGKLVREDSTGAYNTTQLVFDEDVIFPSLIFGQYQKVSDRYQSSQGGSNVDLAVYSWPRATFYDLDGEEPVSFDVTVPGGKPKGILEEAKQIIKFCESLYGPFPYEQLYIAQMSPFLGFGQAPPGFVQLTGDAFMSSAVVASFGGGTKVDYFHEFFSHEIAHQYWAHAIQWALDEDQWLSESFAEYTSGLYVMQLMGQDRFQSVLKEWRDGARLADPHGTTAWANNLRGVNAGPRRYSLIYHKGPYIVHMLRMQIGHENYVKAMKNLTSKYKFQQITTDQMRQEIEAVVGYKLDYFFNQWFRDTGIPTFDYTTEVKQTEDGKWLATVKISQRDKANVKIVSMPVFFHFGKDKVLMKERPILKAEDVYQIKLPEKPERISLDDHKTLLADIVAQGEAAY